MFLLLLLFLLLIIIINYIQDYISLFLSLNIDLLCCAVMNLYSATSFSTPLGVYSFLAPNYVHIYGCQSTKEDVNGHYLVSGIELIHHQPQSILDTRIVEQICESRNVANDDDDYTDMEQQVDTNFDFDP